MYRPPPPTIASYFRYLAIFRGVIVTGPISPDSPGCHDDASIIILKSGPISDPRSLLFNVTGVLSQIAAEGTNGIFEEFSKTY